MKLALIVAMSRNHTIGINNQLPWHLPGDLKFFKDTTMGKPIVMGRKTFESIGRPLPGRPNIVITRNTDFEAEGVAVVASLEEAVEQAARLTVQADVEEAMIIGGAEIYRQVLPLVDRMYITEVDAEIEGDAFFPEFDASQWRQVERESHAPCEKNPYPYSFVSYERLVD